jgi:hypothetical protein
MLQICNIVRLFQTSQNDTLCRETTQEIFANRFFDYEKYMGGSESCLI